MGRTVVTVEIGDPLALNFREIGATVDTNATLYSLPADVLREVGVKPLPDEEAHLADGSTMKVDMGAASIRLEGITIYTDVIFGQPGRPALPVLQSQIMVKVSEAALVVTAAGPGLIASSPMGPG